MYNTIKADNLLLELAEQLRYFESYSNPEQFKMLTICTIENDQLVGTEIKMYKWLYDVLFKIVKNAANIFEEEVTSEAQVCLGIFYLYRLELDEFQHLFDLNGEQCVEKFGGKKLNEKSGSSSVATNIIELVKRRIRYAVL